MARVMFRQDDQRMYSGERIFTKLQDDESLVVRWQTADGRAHETKIPSTRS